jgi:hypothetical protein
MEKPQDLIIAGKTFTYNPGFIHEYLEHLEKTGRAHFAAEIRRKHL